jgi:hypothetical protein
VASDQKAHELEVFVNQTTAEMASEYERIRARATEDPGTAGDEGEENWAALLREWLPSDYDVRTKGRILSHDGTASRQVDIVVLRPGYPRRLLDKKLYVTSGVAAAFECKLTLNAQYILEATETAAQISRMRMPREGTPYRELVSPIVYGLLAHSHGWSSKQVAVEKINEYYVNGTKANAKHPREYLDLVCVADTCTALRSTEFELLTNLPEDTPDRSVCLVGNFFASSNIAPVGSLLAYILIRLGWENPAVRPFADYFRLARMLGRSFGGGRTFDPAGLTAKTEAEALQRSLDLFQNVPWSWDEWAFSLE